MIANITIDIGDILNKLKEADIVEVTRCRDCKYFKPKNRKWGYCDMWGEETQTVVFEYCSRGKRREHNG